MGSRFYSYYNHKLNKNNSLNIYLNHSHPIRIIPNTAKIVPIIFDNVKSDLKIKIDTIATNKIWTPLTAKEYPGFGDILIDSIKKKFPARAVIAAKISNIIARLGNLRDCLVTNEWRSITNTEKLKIYIKIIWLFTPSNVTFFTNKKSTVKAIIANTANKNHSIFILLIL
jgi:hypothetical protein